MPEFVACPACGFRVQMSEGVLGKRVRCISCNHTFVAAPGAASEVPPAPPPASWDADEPGRARRPEPPPLSGGRYDPPAPAYRRPASERDDDEEDGSPPHMPLCPSCARPVAWEAIRCPHCGEELEDDPDRTRVRRRAVGRVRRDSVSHRGPLLANMGNITLVVGGLSLCLAGLGLLVCLPLGITTWVMANHDLEKMRSGEMEPQGRGQTENGRTSAITGIVLSLFFAAGYALLFLERILQ